MQVLDIHTQSLFGHHLVRPTIVLQRGLIFTIYIKTQGGWWTRPPNWKANTAITFAGILAITYGVWTVSAEKEVRYAVPSS